MLFPAAGVEFSYGDNKIGYDITTLPPGAVGCESYESCATKTSKQGFNVGVMIEPISPEEDATFACSSLLCQYAECPDSFRFPSSRIVQSNSTSTSPFVP
ncbi:hypothetical protein F441_02554 [Phytophthora nicotianae CJ01A1]|uniref:Uncharacterized protein n=6 Tax=Phytophthora nicotianae TaxID=4792 RepID=W2QSM8_PHYN3|nr:hypothetical protein PPTG_22104 [Phytophthora nicotianae INRA-310]ETI54636.1 hypothetical protein F443_02602 [Phytophthora nicotianae P1569]ETL47855.1 hypothetical protein L916_02457 [Phytophthora nicotianae]ETO83396.1 hypothetical protein F444_02600 [Phytophthora nicotianae P1976]ETP24478.1 hypothetical protein F441_02554 [Phytophthora nicotianae CJ01A1]ETP52426.1 hypothetical protein F442_02579 [Phytophthora nicotianae P10297]